jgi:hypothetical protein
MAAAATAPAPQATYDRLQENYCRQLQQELAQTDTLAAIQLRTPPAITFCRQVATTWPVDYNPFECPGAPSLPRWEQLLKKFIDNDEVIAIRKVHVLITMARAYNATVHAPSATAPETSPPLASQIEAYGISLNPYARVPSFLQYALSVLTRSLNEEDGVLSTKEQTRLMRFARVWFYALLQGSVDCVLVGYHTIDPYHIWLRMGKRIPVPELWHTLILQYISYEYRFGYSYYDFLNADMYKRLAHLRDEEEPVAGTDAPNDFFKSTYNFKELYDEFRCLPHGCNVLFIAKE